MKTTMRRKHKTHSKETGTLAAYFCLAIAAAILLSLPAFATEAATDTEKQKKSSSLHELIEIAYENNAGISAARAKWQAAVEKYPQAKSLPDPRFSVAYFPKPVETRLGANRTIFKLNQMIPGFGKLKLKGKKAQKMAEMAGLKYDIAVRDVVTDLKVSYSELQYIQEALILVQNNKTLVERLLRIAEKDYGKKKANFHDLLRTQSQLAQVTYDLLLLEELRQTEQTRINSLLNRDPETPVEVPALTTPAHTELDPDSLYKLAEENRQEILMAEVETEMKYFSLGLARKKRKPDFSVGLMYNAIGDAVMPNVENSGRDAWGFMFGFTLPIWHTKNKAVVKEASFEVRAAKNTREDRLNKTFSMLKSLHFKVRNSRRLVDLYEKTLIPQARKSVDLSETWYNSGEASFSELLETQAIWLNFELALARARVDLVQNMARLEKTVGVPLAEAEEGKQ